MTLRGVLWAIAAPLLGVFLTGCAFTESGFDRAASATGGEFSAAATTLSYLHAGKLTAQYARASFADYLSQLQGADQQVQSAAVGSQLHTAHHLDALFRKAEPDVAQPCLGSGCDWRGQVKALRSAADAFVRAGGG